MSSAERRKNNRYSRKRRFRGNKYQTSSGSPQAREGQLQADVDDPGSSGNAVSATESSTGVNKDGSINLSSSNSTSSENCTSAKKINLQFVDHDDAVAVNSSSANRKHGYDGDENCVDGRNLHNQN